MISKLKKKKVALALGNRSVIGKLLVNIYFLQTTLSPNSITNFFYVRNDADYL